MSFVASAAESWSLMRPRTRLELLSRLKEIMGCEEFLWDEVPVEVLADTPDFNSLPGDLCGHLFWSLTESGLTADRFARFCREMLNARPSNINIIK